MLRRHVVGLLLALTLLVALDNVTVGLADQISYSYRWMVTEAAEQHSVAPPLTLLWDQSPIWTLFERWNPGGRSETQDRRIAETPEGLVTVMKKTLYMMDKATGETLWSLPLQGDEIFDWKVVQNVLVYASFDGNDNDKNIRAGVDLATRQQAWFHKEQLRIRYQPEWILPLPNGGAVYSTDYDSGAFAGPLVALDVGTGRIRWRVPKSLEPVTDVPGTWFVYVDRLYIFFGHKRGGLFLQPYDLTSGKKLDPTRIFGTENVGNIFFPFGVQDDGTVFSVYQTLSKQRGPEGLYRDLGSIVAYRVGENKLLWNAPVLDGSEPGLHYVKQLVGSLGNGKPLVIMVWPNRFAMIETDRGVVVKEGILSGYMEWSQQRTAVLYSYPYLFSGACRALDKGTAYDLIALNLESGKIDWTYTIDSRCGTVSSEILNFVVSNNTIYLSRADGRIMAFQPSPKQTAPAPPSTTQATP